MNLTEVKHALAEIERIDQLYNKYVEIANNRTTYSLDQSDDWNSIWEGYLKHIQAKRCSLLADLSETGINIHE